MTKRKPAGVAPHTKKTRKSALTDLEKFRAKEKEGYKRIPAPQPRSK